MFWCSCFYQLFNRIVALFDWQFLTLRSPSFLAVWPQENKSNIILGVWWTFNSCDQSEIFPWNCRRMPQRNCTSHCWMWWCVLCNATDPWRTLRYLSLWLREWPARPPSFSDLWNPIWWDILWVLLFNGSAKPPIFSCGVPKQPLAPNHIESSPSQITIPHQKLTSFKAYGLFARLSSTFSFWLTRQAKHWRWQ